MREIIENFGDAECGGACRHGRLERRGGRRWYVGANLGQSRARIADDRIRDDLLAEGFAVTALKDDSRHFAYKLFGGYQFSRYFALESGYYNLGRFGFTANTAPPAGLTGNIKLQGANFDVVGMLPLTEKFSAFARAGFNYSWVKDEFAGYGAVRRPESDRSEHSSHYKFGFGLQYAITRSWGVRAEAERYRVNDAVGNRGDIDLFSVGLLYRFGGTEPAPVVAQAAPPPPAAPRNPNRWRLRRWPCKPNATAAFSTSSSRSTTTKCSAKRRTSSRSWAPS